MCRFDLTIALDVMMGNQLPQTYNKALSRTLRSKVFVKRMYGKPIIALTLESQLDNTNAQKSHSLDKKGKRPFQSEGNKK